jgi:hypothetical protein
MINPLVIESLTVNNTTRQQVCKPVSEQREPINTCKIDTVETRETFEINHVIMGHCFQAAQDGRIDSDVSF